MRDRKPKVHMKIEANDLDDADHDWADDLWVIDSTEDGCHLEIDLLTDADTGHTKFVLLIPLRERHGDGRRTQPIGMLPDDVRAFSEVFAKLVALVDSGFRPASSN